MPAWRSWFPALLLLVCCPGGFVQTSPTQAPDSIKDPKQLLAAIAPHYDFANPALKPWHFKSTYQIFDKDGSPGERGTYEYWWASPTLYRGTWTRGSGTFSEWHTADGKQLETSGGEAFHFFEREFPDDLLEPLPAAEEMNPDQTWLERSTLSFDKTRAPCIKLVYRPTGHRYPPFPYENPKATVFASYCFDPNLPVVIFSSPMDGIAESFGNFVRVQNRDLPRSFLERVDQRSLLSATIDEINGISPGDPALIPSPDAKNPLSEPIVVKSREMSLRRVRGPAPQYPIDAKHTRLSGVVKMEATIGKDGKIRDLEVVSSPGQILTDAVVAAVRKWEYQPYLINGNPVDVRTEINVLYSIGQ